MQKIIVSQPLRRRIFNQLHGIGHPGGRASVRLIARTYFWPFMQRDIREWSRGCLACQKSKIVRHTKSPLQQYSISDWFGHVHTDIVILPEVEGYRYLISFIDHSSRWVEAKPLRQREAEDVAQAFLEVWVSPHGMPHRLISDRGPQFRSRLFDSICAFLGVDSVRTTTYNPKSNGIVERMQRILKDSLRCRGKNWLTDLPFVLLGLRTAIREDTNTSPAEMVFGTGVRVPGEFFVPNVPIENEHEFVKQLRDTVRQAKQVTFKHKTKNVYYVPRDLFTAKRVFVRVDRVKQPLEMPYDGPFEVIKRHKKYFVVRLSKGVDSVSIDRLKLAYELVPEGEKDNDEGEAPLASLLKKVNFDESGKALPGKK